jgi:hypothetical protein
MPHLARSLLHGYVAVAARDLVERLLGAARTVAGHRHDPEAGLVEVETRIVVMREVGHGEGEHEAVVHALLVVLVDEFTEVAGLNGLVAGVVAADA